jgi:hypothetical protein
LAAPEIEQRPYQSAGGSFMYAMIGIHPDLAFAVGVLSQHCVNLDKDHKSEETSLEVSEGITRFEHCVSEI